MFSRVSLLGTVAVGLLVLLSVCCVVFASEDPWIGVNSVDPSKGPVTGIVDVRTWLSEEADFEQVEFYVDGSSIGVDSSQGFSLKWDTTKLKDGEYNLQVKGTSGSGKVKESQVVVITVKNG